MNHNEDLRELCLSDDIEASDILWSLFYSALANYRHDTLVRPFPPDFVKANSVDKDFQSLAETSIKLPPLTHVNNRHRKIEQSSLDLLIWVLDNDRRNFKLHTCSLSMFDEIRSMTKETLPSPAPNHIFEIKYNESSEAKFNETRGAMDVIYLYHGSRVENFYSILHHGLQAHMTKNALFGEGIYLSSELTVTMPYCPMGHGWEGSCLGDKLSCIAVCEVIDHPSVKCQVEGDDGSQKSRSRIKNSLGGEIPEKYYVVQNNELVRLKYLLVYAERTKRSYRSSWFFQHRQKILFLSYCVMLLAIAVFYNQKTNAYFRRWWRS